MCVHRPRSDQQRYVPPPKVKLLSSSSSPPPHSRTLAHVPPSLTEGEADNVRSNGSNVANGDHKDTPHTAPDASVGTGPGKRPDDEAGNDGQPPMVLEGRGEGGAEGSDGGGEPGGGPGEGDAGEVGADGEEDPALASNVSMAHEPLPEKEAEADAKDGIEGAEEAVAAVEAEEGENAGEEHREQAEADRLRKLKEAAEAGGGDVPAKGLEEDDEYCFVVFDGGDASVAEIRLASGAGWPEMQEQVPCTLSLGP